MLTKASLVLIVAFLVAMLVNQRSQGVVLAQAQTEYKVVDTGILVTPDGKPAEPNPIGLSERVAARGERNTLLPKTRWMREGWLATRNSFLLA